MRITARLSTAGEDGFMSVPLLPHPAEFYALKDGTLNEPTLRRALADAPGITMSSDDDRAVLSFALEFLDRTRISLEQLLKKDVRFNKASGNVPKSRAEKRYEKGKFAYARVDIRHSSTGFRITVSAQNPLGVVGGTETFAKLFAQTYADNIVAITDAMAEIKNAPVTLIDGDGCAGVFAEARKRVNDQVLREKMWDCKRRVRGLCSPIKPDCPFYKIGKCTWC